VTPLGVLETALYADDLQAAEVFYSTVLDLELDSKEDGRHLFFRCGRAMLLIFNAGATATQKGPVPGHGATGPGHVAFSVDATDLDAWDEQIQSRGVEVEARIDWPAGGRSIYFRDPAGNSLELATSKIWGFDASASRV
jgi:catechol 2,3-dioxygenase-like lactoylglutathione lyase family enzyme